LSEELEQKVARLEAHLANLTRRVYELEQGRPQPQAIPLLHEQPAPLASPHVAEPDEVPPLAREQGEEAVAPAPREDWEGSLGASWLSRAGVLLIVIGLVLFLGYAMTSMSAAGRVAIAASAGIAMLLCGYRFEALGNWRPWSLVMIAGGFAVLYATAYAAHAVEAAKVLPQQWMGTLAQTVIALAGVWQAARFASERAAMVAFFAAYVGILMSDSSSLRFAGSLPLTVGGLVLALRLQWKLLPWGMLFYGWMIAAATGDDLYESDAWGQPVSWFTLALLAAYEIWERKRDSEPWQPLWQALNAGMFLLVAIGTSRFQTDEHGFRIVGLLAGVAVATSLIRAGFGFRQEALSEAYAVAGGAIWLGYHFENKDPLLATMLVLAVAMLGLFRHRFAPAIILAGVSELTLAMVSFVIMWIYPHSELLRESPIAIHLAWPQIFILMGCLFAAGRWFTLLPWPSWLALVVLAEITLYTVPKTLATALLAIEAILAVAVGLYLQRRPLRLGGLALFAFSVLKVFFYDLSELDTLPRIFSFLVLGALLLGASWAYTRYRQELQKYL
jgi:hypothetical protein